MSEKTKIQVYIKLVSRTLFHVSGLNPNSTIVDLVREVAKQTSFMTQAGMKSFRLVCCNHTINGIENKLKTISELNIGDCATIYVVPLGSDNPDFLSWNTIEEELKKEKNQKDIKDEEEIKEEIKKEEEIKEEREKDVNSLESKIKSENNLPPLRIIIGVIDLLLLAAAITTFLLFFLTSLSFSIVIPIVLTALFVVGTILFFEWKSILPKILPKSWLEKINLKTFFYGKDENKNLILEEKENPTSEKDQTENIQLS